MASWLVRSTGAGGPGSSPGRGHYVVFLGKTLYSHSLRCLVSGKEEKTKTKLQAWWPHGYCAGLRIEWSRLRTLCCGDLNP